MRLRFTPRSDNKSLCVSFIPIAFQEAAGGQDQQCQVPLAVPHREGMQPEGLCRTCGVREGKVGRRWKRGESGGDAERQLVIHQGPSAPQGRFRWTKAALDRDILHCPQAVLGTRSLALLKLTLTEEDKNFYQAVLDSTSRARC